MSVGSQRLGKGLDALFQNNSVAANMATANTATPPAQTRTEPLQVALSALVSNPQQPRRYFAEQEMEELAASIKAQGVLQPILVRPLSHNADGTPLSFEIVAGERRWRAAQKAELLTVPVVVKEMNDQEVLVVALMENLQREDLTIMEEAFGLQQLKEEFGLSQEDLATRLGKSRPAIANTLRLLSLPEPARNDLTEGRISAGHARALLMVTEPEHQELFRQYMTTGHCTVREAESIAAIWKETGVLPDDLAVGSQHAPAKLGAKKEPDAPLAEIQEKLTAALSMRVKITGKEQKGTLSVKYSSKQELDSLLARFGLGGDAQ